MNIDPNAYMRTPSVPKSPLDPGTAEFVKGKPAIIQPADMSLEQLKSEARVVIKHLDTHLARMLELAGLFENRWREVAPTRDLACSEIFGCSLAALRHKINKWKERLESKDLCDLTEEEDKRKSLTIIADLPDPLAELDVKMAQVVQIRPPDASPKSKPVTADLENGESADDYKRTKATPSESGKPKAKLAVWTEVEHGYGHLLPRIDELNRICPNPSMHRDLLNQTKSCMESLAEWRAMVK